MLRLTPGGARRPLPYAVQAHLACPRTGESDLAGTVPVPVPARVYRVWVDFNVPFRFGFVLAWSCWKVAFGIRVFATLLQSKDYVGFFALARESNS